LASLDSADAPLEFCIAPSQDDYIDLSQTKLRLRVQILSENGEALTNTSTVAPVQNFLHTMFNNLSIDLNQKSITTHSGLYHYRSMLDHTLNYGEDVKTSRLQNSFYYKDTGDFAANDTNDGYIARRDIARGGIFEMLSDVHSDLFNTSKYLLSGVQMNLKFYRNKPEFCLFVPTAENGRFQIKIHEATLLVRKVRLCAPVQLAHAATLSKFTAKYPISRVEMRSVTLNKNLSNHVVDNVILGQIPKRITVFFVDSAAFAGSYKTNPLYFKHHSHTFLTLHTDTGTAITPMRPNFPGKHYMSSYNTLFNATGTQFSETCSNISYQEYSEGYCFTIFDLTPDLSASQGHLSAPQSGNLRLEVNFERALANPVTAVLYCEFDNIIEISESREVFTDYST
jgi:hypothetical protein